jgi:hypothetical protein
MILGGMITLVGFQTVGLLVLRRLVGWFGLGPSPDLSRDTALIQLRDASP